MLFLLIVSNILRIDDNGDIMYNNWGMEFILVDISFEFYEKEFIIFDELLELDNDILCFSVEIDEYCYLNFFFDLVVFLMFMCNGRELNVDDNDDLSYCNFFVKVYVNILIVIINIG